MPHQHPTGEAPPPSRKKNATRSRRHCFPLSLHLGRVAIEKRSPRNARGHQQDARARRETRASMSVHGPAKGGLASGDKLPHDSRTAAQDTDASNWSSAAAAAATGQPDLTHQMVREKLEEEEERGRGSCQPADTPRTWRPMPVGAKPTTT